MTLKTGLCNKLQVRLYLLEFLLTDAFLWVVCHFCCFPDLSWERLHHVRCTVCNCKSSVFVYLTWPLKACNNDES